MRSSIVDRVKRLEAVPAHRWRARRPVVVIMPRELTADQQRQLDEARADGRVGFILPANGREADEPFMVKIVPA